jgi:hypothetical protein
MITTEEYLKAIEIIEQYHKQVEEKIKAINKPSLIDIGLKRNDYIKYIGGLETINLTIGEKYRLTGEPYHNSVCVINNSGFRRRYNERYFELI